MNRWIIAALGALGLGACGNSARPVNIPAAPTGDHEADCQRLCALPAGDPTCTTTHQQFCISSCRERTNGLAAACASCIIAAGSQLMGGVDGIGDPFCQIGGPATLAACTSACDDKGVAPPAPTLGVLCDLECGFYMSDATPLACSDGSSQDCRNACAAAIAGHGRVCAQCLAEETEASKTCLNSDCDCDPLFTSTSSDCTELCDMM